MIFRRPLPFLEALQSREIRQLLPTEFRTELLDEIPAQLRERAFFSAGVTNTEFLQEATDGIDSLLSGSLDRATKRLQMKQLLGRLEYKPSPGEAGTLTDLSSDRRLNLILDTNLEMAQGYGQWKQGQDAAVLDEWPAQELVRVRDSKVPRDWPARWAAAGGTLYGNRMVALKNAPVWTAISRFGTPYPPFDFNSGMDVVPVDRNEAVALGLIDRDTQIFPQERPFNADLQASPDVRSSALRRAVEEHIASTPELAGKAGFDSEGVLRFAS